MLAQNLECTNKRDAIAALYGRFLELNQPFLILCTEWQTRMVDDQQVVNDHQDPAYDLAVIERLAETDTRIQPICAELGEHLDRFNRYGSRFSHALACVQRGDTEWFTKAVIDSYHTIWFELHEDLLATLGKERATEGHA